MVIVIIALKRIRNVCLINPLLYLKLISFFIYEKYIIFIWYTCVSKVTQFNNNERSE